MFHWISALLVGVAWLLGTLGDDFPSGRPRRLAELVHVSAGQLILVLLVLRIAWRLVAPPPHDEPSPLGLWAARGAKVVHFALYALLIAVPLVGVATLFAGGDALPLFGFGVINSPWLQDKALKHSLKEIHEILANALVVVATMHASAALVHHFVFRDRVLQRMLPWG